MAQLRQDIERFRELDTEVIVVGPEGAKAFRRFWQQNELPFTGLPDPRHRVLRLYGQKVNLFKLGRMPAQAIIDRQGMVRYLHYGDSMADIPSNERLLTTIKKLAGNDPGRV